MSRVLALGSGAMGTKAARVLSAFDEVESITIADLNEQSAQRAALACNGKGRATVLDVTKQSELVQAMSGHDVVMNCVGPFFKFGVPVLEAAIAAGVNYTDICDDPEPTRDMLEMNDKAQRAGMTAIIGMGASPGITNLLGARAYGALDTVEEMLTAWNIEENVAGSGPEEIVFSAAVIHWMQQCSGTILECSGGKLIDGTPLDDIPIDYPGRGKRTLYSVGHPEPVSYHYSYPEVRRTRCAMVMPSAWIDFFRTLQRNIDTGKQTLEQAGHELVDSVAKGSLIDKLVLSFLRLFDGPRLPYFFSMARGLKDGREAAAFASIKSIPEGMDGATGIPLALGALMLLQGHVQRRGVMAPEKAIDPDRFFNLLAPFCTVPAPCPANELVRLEWA